MSLSITAIIPTYNRAHLLGRAISSVLNQLDDNDEVIVVDDGSDDNTQEVVQKFGDHVKYIHTPNRGAGSARNTGVKVACKQLVAFCDSDDEWLPGKVEVQRNFMQAWPDILFCFSNFSFKEIKELGGNKQHFYLSFWPGDMKRWEEVLDSGRKMSTLISLPKGMEDFNCYVGNIYQPAMSALYMNVNTLMVQKEKAADALYFAEDTPTYEDWECFGRLAKAGKCAYLDCETACQHSHGGERLTDAHTTECAQARVKILTRIWGNDNEFLRQHSELYQKVLDSERLKLADGLLIRGVTKIARMELRKIKGRTPLIQNILAILPGSITKNLLSLRRVLKAWSATSKRGN